MNKLVIKKLVIALMFLSDMALSAWVYFKFKQVTSLVFISDKFEIMPNFQAELHAIILKSYYLLALLFLAAQFLCYLTALRGLRSTYLYLKFYSVFAFAIAFLVVLKFQHPYALLPAIIYVWGYYVFAKLFKETAVLWQKTLPQSTQEKKRPLFG